MNTSANVSNVTSINLLATPTSQRMGSADAQMAVLRTQTTCTSKTFFGAIVVSNELHKNNLSRPGCKYASSFWTLTEALPRCCENSSIQV